MRSPLALLRLGSRLGVLAAVGGERLTHVHLFSEAAVLVAPHIAFVALVRLDQFAA